MKYCNVFMLVCSLLFVRATSQTIHNIAFEGNHKTKTKVLNKLIRSKNGKILDSIVLKNDAVLLSRLPSFSKVSYQVKKENDNDNITYVVEETNTLIPSVNFWTTTNQQFTYQIGLTEFNFLGENKQLGGFYRNNGFHSFSLIYTNPLWFGNFTGASVILQSLTSLEPLYFNGNQAKYEYTNSSVEFSLFHNITASHKALVGLNFFREDYQHKEGFKSDEIPLSFAENKLLVKGGFDYNHLNFEYQYVDGIRSNFNVQYVLPVAKEQREFYILWNDFFYYKRIQKQGNLATRVRLGIASNNDNPFAPFPLDNNVNIRGVGNVIDRGTAVAVANIEYRYTILDKSWFTLQTNTFIDMGNWRTAGGDFKQLLEKDELRLHPGVGLRFINKKIYNAVFRLDYGASIVKRKSEKGIVFGIGQYF